MRLTRAARRAGGGKKGASKERCHSTFGEYSPKMRRRFISHDDKGDWLEACTSCKSPLFCC